MIKLTSNQAIRCKVLDTVSRNNKARKIFNSLQIGERVVIKGTQQAKVAYKDSKIIILKFRNYKETYTLNDFILYVA